MNTYYFHLAVDSQDSTPSTMVLRPSTTLGSILHREGCDPDSGSLLPSAAKLVHDTTIADLSPADGSPGRSEAEPLRLHASRAAGVDVPVTRMSRFQSLLESPDEKVLMYVARYFAAEAQFADTSAAAAEIYNAALALPHTETRLAAVNDCNLAVNGQFQANVPCRSVLWHAFHIPSLSPSLLKIPRTSAEAQHEFDMWNRVAHAAQEHHLAGPMELITLRGEGRLSLKMPVFPATMEHVPRPMAAASALQVGEDVLCAIEFLASVGLNHNDVKAPNVFISANGRAYLGDYGSITETDTLTSQRTSTHLPYFQDDVLLNTSFSSKKCDRLLLAVTLLAHVSALKLTSVGPAYTTMVAAAEAVVDTPLKQFIKSRLLLE